MPLGDFVEAGTMAKPLPIGRAARLIAGVGALFYFVWNISRYTDLVGSSVPGYWVGVGFAFWFFSDLWVVGFSRNWGRWPQLAVFPFALALVISDLVAYGSAWGPPLAWGVFIFTEFFFGLIGVSFVLAAVLAVPG